MKFEFTFPKHWGEFYTKKGEKIPKSIQQGEKYKVVARNALACKIQLVEGVNVEIPLTFFNIALIELSEFYEAKMSKLRMEIVRYVKIDVSKFTHVGNKKKLLTTEEKAAEKTSRVMMMSHEMEKLRQNIEKLKPKIVEQLKKNRKTFVEQSIPPNLSVEERTRYIKENMMVKLRNMTTEIKNWEESIKKTEKK